PQIPLLSVRQQLATGIHLIVQAERLMHGTRNVMKITEVTGLQAGIIMTQDIFEFVQTGTENGQVTGEFRATGVVPRFLDRIRSAGIQLPLEMFQR
ncbi:MAG: CpaF family protein, partial [Anaerolineae bacterium]|nr:CpaF family protein [Anaerolineae bacterium]